MTEICNPEIQRQPESLGRMLEARFEEAYSLQSAGIEGYIVEPKGAKAHFIRLHKDEADYDLMVGKPLPESDMPPNIDYSIITIRWRNFLEHGNEDMLVLKDRPDRLYEDIGDYHSGSPISDERVDEVLEYVTTAQLQDRQI